GQDGAEGDEAVVDVRISEDEPHDEDRPAYEPQEQRLPHDDAAAVLALGQRVVRGAGQALELEARESGGASGAMAVVELGDGHTAHAGPQPFVPVDERWGEELGRAGP